MLIATSTLSEPQFAELVHAIADDPVRREDLTSLLREDHSFYHQRGTAATVRMRAWVLLALARAGMADAALSFILEELDTGTDPYLVAAAAYALRSCAAPSPEFAPFVMRAITNLRYRNDPVSLKSYGGYAASANATSPIRELLATLKWLGPQAREVAGDVESLRNTHGGLPKKLHAEVDAAVQAIRGSDQHSADPCCTLPGGLGNMFSSVFSSRRDSTPVEEIIFQDQDGASITFREFFRGCPSIIVFFYTRCDNPLKCSLTITKLARVQKLLEAQGLAGKIHTAAITYDPGFDLPLRLRSYGQSRGVVMDDGNRLLRTTNGFIALCNHFKLGVNFVESLVNRHKVEAYVLDTDGRMAASFERIRWDEQQVVDRTVELLNEKNDDIKIVPSQKSTAAPQMLGTFASVGLALFPKCPLCWAGYLSMFGIASLEKIPYSPWLQPLLIAAMLINLASVWLRRRSPGGTPAFCLVVAGALAIVVSRPAFGWEWTANLGIALTLTGSLLSALTAKTTRVATGEFQEGQEHRSNSQAAPIKRKALGKDRSQTEVSSTNCGRRRAQSSTVSSTS